MRKFALLLILLLTTVIAVSVNAQADATRVFEPLDRGLQYRFTYPIGTHSVRTSNLHEPTTGDPVVFGGLIAVEPNDFYLYATDDLTTSRSTQMRVLAIPVAQKPANLADLVGTLPLWDADSHTGEVTDTTLGGQPAVRLDDPDRQAVEIIAYYDGVIYEIVIDTVPLSMGFHLPAGTGYDPAYDDILASWTFGKSA